MSVSKDPKKGTWTMYTRYKDWQGITREKRKRGFKTKREALEYERQFLLPFAPIEEALEACRQRGHALTGDGGRWRLTPEGFLLSNSIISDLLIAQENSEPLRKL